MVRLSFGSRREVDTSLVDKLHAENKTCGSRVGT